MTKSASGIAGRVQMVSRRIAGTSSTPEHPLVGRGLHYKDEHGCVANQAKILAVMPSNSPVGDLVLIQYFEWFGGDPSTQRLLPLTELTASSGTGASGSERWVFYENVEAMNDHYERIDSRQSEHIRAQLLPPKKPGAPEPPK